MKEAIADMALSIIRRHGGMIRTKTATAAGIQSRTLSALVQKGKLELSSRGVYRLTESELSSPDLFIVATRVPNAVVCLISALSFHDMTTQIPHKIHIAIERSTRAPQLEYPPLAVYRFSGNAYHEGIELHIIDGIETKIYSAEKTLADCFKFRNQIGMDVVLEALKLYRSRKKLNMKMITHYADVCRVSNVMRPYIQSLV
ncbi:type IV toxin-antitoxin system AbiEi family antitoxin domain-containing protein [Parachryseolinea silvisoli]|uniref:type IV toxin-antitoxin system AbiEi family antitoxin domain-containing protein n=1 Tax=Parachryseolinea silvisoli TaxID=2873601 RepID=UPI002265C7E1|nr:type IV toxin-antitoxin system AbiEi family antitoxin domain-containing protein [Parachryseolinea silvisoli]MCD9019159.1 type IV toxin-antitoxin system AbiEi family antitoxin domain-containing protein [Parachryseolinea silvisoli]